MKLDEHFVAGTTARTAARLVRVNKTTAAYYYHRLRELIYQAVADATPFAGEIEVDESYSGGQRKGKRGRGAAGKVPVFGRLKRGGKVHAAVIAAAKSATLLPILKQRMVPDSIVHSDSLPSYNALAAAGFRHVRINHARLFAAGKNHINGIENFWNQAKRHLRKFNGVPKEHFPLFLKECEWRFNNPNP
jgi:transposase